MSETQLVRGVEQALVLRGYLVARINAGQRYHTNEKTGRRYCYRGAPPGWPDILGALRSGRMFGIECKTAKGQLRPTQKAWRDKAEATGARFGVARTIKQALALVNGWEAADA